MRKIENIFVSYIFYGKELTAICLLCIVFYCYRSHSQRLVIHTHTQKKKYILSFLIHVIKKKPNRYYFQCWPRWSSSLPKSSLLKLKNPWMINKSITKSVINKKDAIKWNMDFGTQEMTWQRIPRLFSLLPISLIWGTGVLEKPTIQSQQHTDKKSYEKTLFLLAKGLK